MGLGKDVHFEEEMKNLSDVYFSASNPALHVILARQSFETSSPIQNLDPIC